MPADDTIRTALRAAFLTLDAAQVDAPQLTARLLLGTVLGHAKEWLLAHDGDLLTTADALKFETLLRRVKEHEPLAYVLGHREFYGLDLLVDRRVLIPRPETEMLVDLALAALAGASGGGASIPGPAADTREGGASMADRADVADIADLRAIFDIADIGTGSGAVAIAVAARAPHARVIAIDVSHEALEVARANAERHGVAGRIEFVWSDLLERVDGLPRVLTANLPYVTREEIDMLPPEIQAHEPRVALDGGKDGLDLVRALLRQIAARVAAAGPASPLRAAFFEIGAIQGRAALAAAREILPGAQSAILKDLGKRDRVLAIHYVSSWDNQPPCAPK